MLFNRRLFLVGVIFAVMLAAVFGGFSAGSGKLAQVAQNTAHVPAFGFVAWLALRWLQSFRLSRMLHWQGYLAAFTIAVALGIVVELVQRLLQRDAEISDVIHDALGALGVLCFCASAQIGSRSRTLLLVLLISGALSLGVGTYPLAWATVAWFKREQQFPQLVSFDSQIDAFFLVPEADARIVEFPQSLAQEPHERALLLPLVNGEYPGVEIARPHADWRGYEKLVLDVANPADRPVSLSLRVHDRKHNSLSNDRFSSTQELPPRARVLYQLRLTDIESAPATRRMDMSQIASVIIFSSPEPGTQVLLKGLWLQ